MKTYRLEINNSTEYTPDLSKDIRILYMIDGQCTASIGFSSGALLKKEDFLLINSVESFTMSNPQKLLYAVLFIDYYSICNELQDETAAFKMDSREKTDNRYQHFRRLLQDFLLAAIKKKKKNHYQEQGLYYLLLDSMIRDFRNRQAIAQPEKQPSQAEEMRRYVQNNFKQEISLNKIAADLYISPSAASRLFQKTFGENFVSYVKRIRLEQVKEELIETDLSVTTIALRNGFEVPASMTRSFREKYGITPSEYREQVEKHRILQHTQDVASEAEQILELDKKRKETDADYSIIRTDLNIDQPWRQWKDKVLVLGPLHMLSSGNIQNQILFLSKKLKANYIYVWSPFSKHMMIRGEKEDNFSYMDIMLDFCVDHDLQVMMDLSQRKEASLASSSSEIYSFENDLVFRNKEEWAQTLTNFLRHIASRYGQEIVSRWIFEFNFFLNDKAQYLAYQSKARDLWKKGYSLIKEHIPKARVAGPGLPATEDMEMTRMLIRDFLFEDCRPDIFTFMLFPYQISSGFVYGNSPFPYLERTSDPDVLLHQINSTMEALETFDYRGECWTVDWGVSLSNRDYIQDSCFRGTFLLKNVIMNMDKISTFGISCVSDLTNIYQDSKAVLCGSSGMLSRNGIPKPACYAIDFLASMGDCLVYRSDECAITKKNSGEIIIICYNYVPPDSTYYLKEENQFTPQSMEKLFARGKNKCLDFVLKVSGEERDYLIRQKTINQNHGSVLNQWISFSCYEELIKEDVEYLRSLAVPEVKLERLKVVNENLRFSVDLNPNEIRMITIHKE